MREVGTLVKDATSGMVDLLIGGMKDVASESLVIRDLEAIAPPNLAHLTFRSIESSDPHLVDHISISIFSWCQNIRRLMSRALSSSRFFHM